MKKDVLFQNSPALVFKQWSNTSYAIFKSLHKLVHISILLLAYSLVSIPFVVQAQTDTTTTDRKINLDEVVVSAQRNPATHSQTARVVTVLDKIAIKNAAIQTVDDLLRYLPNIDLRQRGKYGAQADVAIRGGSFDQVLILLNGINITDPHTGHHNLNLPVDLDDVERIEILEGPASKVLGPNAFSGAINFITGTKDKNNIGAHVMFGEHQLHRTNLNANIIAGKTKHYISATKKGAEGHIDNTDFYAWNAFYHGQLKTDEADLALQLGFINKAFGSNSFYTPKYPNQYEETKTFLGSLKLTTGDKVKFTPSLYWRRNYDHYLLFRDNPAAYENFHSTDVYGANMNVSFQTKLGKTAIGADFRSESVLSNRLGNDLEKQIEVPGFDGKFYTKSHSRTNISYFVEHSIYLQRFIASVGVMGNINSDLINDFNWQPGAEVAYFLTDEIKAYSAVNTAMRMPTFTDLFYQGPTNVGNPDLKPEKSITYEFGFKFQNKFVRAHANVFHRQGENMIDWVKATEDEKWKPLNLTDVDATGYSSFIQIYPSSLGLQFLKNIQLSYTFMEQEKASGDLISRYVLDYLRHKLSIGAEFGYKGFSLSLQNTYQDREGQYTKWENNDWGDQVDYNPFWLTDARLSWTNKFYTIYFETANVFDVEVIDLSNLPQPGRWFSGGLKINLDL